MKKIHWERLIILVLMTAFVGILSNLLSGNDRPIYNALLQPPLSPPGWVFGIVWPVLYILMSVGAYLVYEAKPSAEREKATRLYWLQLLVNFLWPIVFFRFGWYWLAVGIVALLDVLVYKTTGAFYKTNKTAGYLMIPYLLWLLVATYLSIGVAVLN